MDTHLAVFGNPGAFRSRLRKRISRGEQILQQIEGASLAVVAHAAETSGLIRELGEIELLEPVGRTVINWTRANRTLVATFLGPKADENYGTRPAPTAARFRVRADDLPALESLVRFRLEELASIERRLPARRQATIRPIDLHSLNELRWSGLFDTEVLDDFERRLSVLSEKRKWRGAIGAAKEMVEAINRAAVLTLTGTPAPRAIEFGPLGKAARSAMKTELRRQNLAAATVDEALRLEQGLTSVLQSLAELRNAEGDGHGRARTNPGLAVRHVELAVGSALVYCNFVIATLNDLGALPSLA